jgi:hypothetical protein
MKRFFCLAAFAMATQTLSGCGGGSGNVQQPPPPPAPTPGLITAISGTPQSAPINSPFAAPLVAKVTDMQNNPVDGVVVTFMAPPDGPSGMFAGGVNTATTNADGVATSPIFTANSTLGGPYAVGATVVQAGITAVFNLTNTAGPPAQIIPQSGSGQSAAINTAFIEPLVVHVTDSSGDSLGGVLVAFNAPSSGASVTFAGGVNTATTNSSGIATSASFTANGTAGGPYNAAATVTGTASAASFSLTNAMPGPSNNYSFIVSGLEAARYGTNCYTLAGSVTIDSNGYVLAGEQDYKDDWNAASPQPAGDSILGGELTVSATTGQGTLTLITNNTLLGANGIETLAVQFVNTKHALIGQFDGSATSSGSLDLQTLPSTLNGAFSFNLLGTDANDFATVAGGVFLISGTSLTNGIYDFDDIENGTGNGTVTTGAQFTGTISAPDPFGRGSITITNTNLPSEINYYIVGPEVLRLIVVGPGYTSGSGSAFGQGTSAGTFKNASLGSSVFAVESNSNVEAYLYAATGMLTTNPGAGTFQGVGDDDEEGAVVSGATISGTYSITNNGYGSLRISPGDLGSVTVLGIYMTDPNLNLNDPNNTTSELGGALVADLDANIDGTGVLVPQTDTSVASFAGSYAFAAHEYNQQGETGWEDDFVGQGTVTGGILNGTGLVSDPGTFFYFGDAPTNSGVTFSGTAAPDTTHSGRYTLAGSGLAVTISGRGTYDYSTVVIYQASGDQLFWMNEDSLTLFLGPLQQQALLSGLPGAK